MEEPLDPVSFRKSRYARPQQKWICGRAAQGCPCPLGPDKSGHCRATGECFPAKKGDHWHCTRSEAQGGKCPDGPLPNGECCRPIPPCEPVRSLRAQRGRFTRLLVTLTGGILLLALASPALRKVAINPGPLTVAHATSATRCSDCHTPGGVLAGKVPRGRALADSQRCLECHQLGRQPLAPHGAPAAALAGLAQEIQKRNKGSSAPALVKVSSALASHAGAGGELACATCHQEHHGRTFDLTRISNTQCQVCHSTQFASFENGHPGFGKYPYEKPTRISFNHAAHYDEHFAENKAAAPSSCQTCHTPDAAGRLMLVKGFEQTCAACHAAQIRGDGMTTRGIAFFTVPGVDVETLAAKGFRVGTWPKSADGKITGFMRLLLNADPTGRAALATLGNAEIFDLSQATPERLQAAAQLAWSVKGLLFDLETQGQSFVLQRLQSEANVSAGPTAASLVGQMPPDVVMAAQQAWFPQLLEEVSNHRQGVEPAASPTQSPAASPTTAPSPAPSKPADDDSLLGGGAPVAPPPAKAPVQAATDDSLLGGGDSPSPAPAATAQPAAEDSGDLLSTAPPAGTPPATPPPAASPVTPMLAEDWVSAGGWYCSKDSFTLLYRPTGHADTFLTAWLDLTVARAGSPPAGAADPLFASLSDPQAPGLCSKCHLVSRASGVQSINWTAARPVPHDHPFTKFDHSAHLSLLNETGCQTCHRLNPSSRSAADSATSAAAGAGVSPIHFETSFAALPKEVCAQCHKPEVAGDSCLQCHSYHTGTFAAQLRVTPQNSLAAGK